MQNQCRLLRTPVLHEQFYLKELVQVWAIYVVKLIYKYDLQSPEGGMLF